MKISCLQENLKKGLATVSRAVASKSPLPVLSNVLLATDGGRLKLAATDLEIGITCWIGAKVEEEGSVTIPSRLFNDVVGNLPNDKVVLTLDARTQTITIECGRFTSHIKGIEADEFPTIPTVTEHDTTFKLPPDTLKQSIAQVSFAASNDETRPVLTGVLIHLGETEPSGNRTVVFAAADGYRLATRSVLLPEDTLVHSPTLQDFIVPARALNELARIISDSSDDVVITVTPSGGQVLFHHEATELTSRLIDGKFPDYQRIIPTTYTTRTILDTQELMKAVKLASFFATSSQGFIKLTIEAGDDEVPGKIIINANAAEVGDNTGEVDAIVHGESGAIAMNVKYLTEALAAMETVQIAIETQSSQNPGVFKPLGKEGYVHIIMPMTMRG
jgi:DNA polymerase III subunit beta